MVSSPTFRLAVPAERSALEELQRRASLIWEEDRAALLANPDAIELPLEQITGGRTVVAESAGQLLGFSVVLPRDDGDAELDGLFVEPTYWRHGLGRALVEQAERIAGGWRSEPLGDCQHASARLLRLLRLRQGRRSRDAFPAGAQDAEEHRCRTLTQTFASR